jgi:uroporphyrinogen-III synthase
MDILSTKKLTAAQQELVLNSGCSLVHYNILQIEQRYTDLSPYDLSNVIITSSNALPAMAAYRKDIKNLFVVGDKTAATLISQRMIPQLTASDSASLAHSIIENHDDKTFTYLCGSHRRDELPSILNNNKVLLEEVIVYDSTTVARRFDRKFAAVLMYSPRGVYAFAKANQQQPQRIVCIGETTATAARELFENVYVAKLQTVENVLVTAINLVKNDQK